MSENADQVGNLWIELIKKQNWSWLLPFLFLFEVKSRNMMNRWTMFFLLFELHVCREADFDVLWMKQLIFEWHRGSPSLERDLSASTHDVFQAWLRPEESCGLCWTKFSLAALMDGCRSSLI